MDVDDFLKATEPKVKRSVLDPFFDDIKKLRDNGRTLQQVCDFLKANKVEITVAGLSKFLERRSKNKTDLEGKKLERKTEVITTPQKIVSENLEQKTDVQNDGLTPADREKKRLDDLAKKYVTDEPNNQLINLLTKDKK